MYDITPEFTHTKTSDILLNISPAQTRYYKEAQGGKRKTSKAVRYRYGAKLKICRTVPF